MSEDVQENPQDAKQTGDGRGSEAALTEDEELEQRLAAPVFAGTRGLDTAQIGVAGFLVLVAGILAFTNALSVPFHVGERELIVEESALHHLTTFSEAMEEESGRQPLVLFLDAMNWVMGAGNPAVFRAVNVFFHLLNGLLVYLVARRLLRNTPEIVTMLAGMLFVLHPLTTEAVVHLGGRGELISTTFVLLSLFSFASYIPLQGAADKEDAGKPRVGWLIVSLTSFGVSWALCERAVVLPLLILCVDRLFADRRVFKARLAGHVAFWGLGIILVVAHMAVMWPRPVLSADPSVGERILTQLAMLPRYVYLTIIPYDLSVYHPGTFVSAAGGPPIFLGAVLFVILIGAGAILLALRSIAGLALLWPAITLVLGAALVPLNVPMAERFAYLSLVGPVLLVPWVFTRLASLKIARLAVGFAAAALIVTFGLFTFGRNNTWAEPISLWKDAAAHAPNAGLPERVLGLLYLDRAQEAAQGAAILALQNKARDAQELQEEAKELFSAAQPHIQRAIELDPKDAAAQHGSGLIRQYMGDYDAAFERFLEALQLDMINQQWTLDVAALLDARAAQSHAVEDILHAVDYYQRAERLKPLPAESRARYALALAGAGYFQAAEQILADMVGDDKTSPLAGQLESIRQRTSRIAEIEESLSKVNPASLEALRLRAQILMIREQHLEASYLLSAILDSNPADVGSWLLLGIAKAQMDSAEAFARDWPVAPGGVGAWRQVARQCALNGDMEAALTYLEAEVKADGSGGIPKVLLAGILNEVQRNQEASEYLHQAAQEHPDSPVPWLHLADLALGRDDYVAALGYIGEAEKRGANAGQLDERRDRAETLRKERDETGAESILR